MLSKNDESFLYYIINMKKSLSPNAVTYCLMGVNLLYFLFLTLHGRTEYDMDLMLRYGAVYEPLIFQEHQYYRLLTACFMHFGIEHLVNNMLVLFVTGGYLEQALGHVRYLILYLTAGVLANLISCFWNAGLGEAVVSAGASGAVFAVVGGLLWVALRNRGRLGNLTLRQLLIMAVLSFYLGFTEGGVDNAAHLGGLVSGFLLAIFLYWPKKD